jgi:predicted deacylase
MACMSRSPFVVGSATAGPGERGFGHIEVALPDGETLRVACWVVRGREDGPVLYVHSTQHGNEISGIEVVRRVTQTVDPRRLRGTLIAVPIANPLAFHWRRHHYLQAPEEAYQGRPELDIDHWWPGQADGTHAQRLAHALWHNAVQHATHVLDMHTWNRWQAAATTVRPQHGPSLDLARAFGQWVQCRSEASEATAAPFPPFGSITGVAIRHGKAACAPNFTGQWDIYEPEVRRGVAGLRNVLHYLEMLPGEPWPMAPDHGAAPRGRPAPPVFNPDDLVDVMAPRAGIFLPRVRPEARVQRGESLGQLVPFDDFAPVDVESPHDALVYLVGAISAGADVSPASMMPIAKEGGRVARLLPQG